MIENADMKKVFERLKESWHKKMTSRPKPKEKRICNRHYDCDAADEKARAAGSLYGASHCHDECCEECFGY